MKPENPNVRDREISFRNREATLARLVAEMQMLRELVRLEEMKLAGETGTTRTDSRAGDPSPLGPACP